MTRLEYFNSLFPRAEERYLKYAGLTLCCRNLGITEEECDDNLSCKECWNKTYEYADKLDLPKSYTQPLLDKFIKLW